MQIALERRRQALEAVRGIDAIMARAKPGVEHATQALEDVEDCARQINRDCASATEALDSAAAKATKGANAVRDAAASLAKLKEHHAFALVAEGGEVESEAAGQAVDAADEALAEAEGAAAAIAAEHDVAGTKKRYATLRTEAREMANDVRDLRMG